MRDDGHLSGVRSEEEIYMMHQAAYRYCRPEASIKFDTYHVDGRTIVVATVPRSDRRPVYALDDEGQRRAYIRIADENIVASPVHIKIWRDEQSPRGAAFTYGEADQRLMAAMTIAPDAPAGQTVWLRLNQIVRRSRLPRPKVITLLARLVRFGLVSWRLEEHQFVFALN